MVRERRFGKWLAAADPGFNRLRLSVRVVGGVGAAMAMAFGVAHVAGRSPQVPILLAAFVALMIGFMANDATVRGQAVSTVATSVALGGALAAGSVAAGQRTLSLVLLAALVFAAVWMRRFGPLSTVVGHVAWLGFFMGVYLGPDLTSLSWAEVFVGVGVLAGTIVGLGPFCPRPAQALRRTQRSFLARADDVSAAAAAVVSAGADDSAGVAAGSTAAEATRQVRTERLTRRLRRAQDRLNEAALMIDAQLATPSAVPEGTSAQRLNQYLFEAELGVQTVARMAERLASCPLPAVDRARVADAIEQVRAADPENAAEVARQVAAGLVSWTPDVDADPSHARTVIYRLAGGLVAWAEAAQAWLAVGEALPAGGDEPPFRPTVDLVAGYLPGSASVASTAAGRHRGLAARLRPTTRLAIQMTVAVSLAIVVGDALSGQRFYWSPLAAYLVFFGCNTTGEQVTKAFNRVLGTAVGLVSGILLAHLVWHRVDLAIAVCLVALLLSTYLLRVSYALFVIGLVTMLAQVYVQFGVFTDGLLFLRLAETAVGAAIAMAVAVLVFPVRTDRVVRVALSAVFERLDSMLGDVGGRFDDREARARLHHDARMLDHAFQTLAVTARPLSRTLFGSGSDRVTAQLAGVSALRHYAANLAHFAESLDVETLDRLHPEAAAALKAAVAQMQMSIEAVDTTLNERGRTGRYERAAADLDRLAERLRAARRSAADTGPSEAQTASGVGAGRSADLVAGHLGVVLHYLGLIDDTLAELAAGGGLMAPGDEFAALADHRWDEVAATAGARALVGTKA
jgi:uncharacterized membrane protein YccC